MNLIICSNISSLATIAPLKTAHTCVTEDSEHTTVCLAMPGFPRVRGGSSLLFYIPTHLKLNLCKLTAL